MTLRRQTRSALQRRGGFLIQVRGFAAQQGVQIFEVRGVSVERRHTAVRSMHRAIVDMGLSMSVRSV